MSDDPAHPHVGNRDSKPGLESSFWWGDINNPNLTDFAKEGLKNRMEPEFYDPDSKAAEALGDVM